MCVSAGAAAAVFAVMAQSPDKQRQTEPCPACSQYAGLPFHKPSVTEQTRCSKGVIPKGHIPAERKHGDTGCRRCGSVATHGSIVSFRPCMQCGGTGVAQVKVKKATPQAHEQPPKKGQAQTPPVTYAEVGNCTACKGTGKISTREECGLCANGYNHKKNPDGTFECRNCKRKHAERFAPCPCAKPDCPQCGGNWETVREEKCPDCCDGIIMPLKALQKKLLEEGGGP